MPFRARISSSVPPLPDSLRLLANLDNEQFAVLVREVRGPKALRRDRARAEALTIKLDLANVADTLGLLATVDFFYERSQEWAVPGERPREVIRAFLESTGLWSAMGPDPEMSMDRLLSLVEENDALRRDKKRHWLRTGMIDTAVGFVSFVDLRPNFTPDRDQIEELVPVILFSIEVENDTGEEKAFVFQLGVEDFEQFRMAIHDTHQKIALLRDQYADKLKIVFDDGNEDM